MRVAYLLPDPEQPGLSAAERLALTVRNTASVSGRCACGAAYVLPNRRMRRAGVVGVLPMAHEADCPAVSRVLDGLAKRLGSLRYRLIIAEVGVAA